ncbi:TPA: hypothetical protein ACTXAP_004251, partial [Raoultella planticola]
HILGLRLINIHINPRDKDPLWDAELCHCKCQPGGKTKCWPFHAPRSLSVRGSMPSVERPAAIVAQIRACWRRLSGWYRIFVRGRNATEIIFFIFSAKKRTFLKVVLIFHFSLF